MTAQQYGTRACTQNLMQVRLAQLDKEGHELRDENAALHTQLARLEEAALADWKAQVRACIHAFVCVCAGHVGVHAHSHARVHEHVLVLCVCMRVYMRVHSFVHTRACICVCVTVHAMPCVCMYVCLCIRCIAEFVSGASVLISVNSFCYLHSLFNCFLHSM